MAKVSGKEKTTSKKVSTKSVEEVVETPIVTVEKIKSEEPKDKGANIEKKLVALLSLQKIDSQIDKIRIVRGELPLEVQDLEDEIAGLGTRIDNFIDDIQQLEKIFSDQHNTIKDCNILIKKYEEQQSNVRNNREYDSITKEIEYQNLEIQLCEKKSKEFAITLENKKLEVEKAQGALNEKKNDLEIKKAELDDIISETEKDEKDLIAKSEENQKIIEDRFLIAYKRIRKNASNGLAVVGIERHACGGCFSKIPPQRQLDIKMHKKIIVCEYCGRILVDNELLLAINS